MDYITIIIIIVAIIFLLIIILNNRIIKLKIRCDNAWASIDNQLKRRSDLIPNLVEITKGYATYECETLVKLIEKRTNNITEKGEVSEEISKNINRIFAISESYPNLKASELFLNLQIELTGTEDKIAYARQFYNDCVQHFNTFIMIFPINIIASSRYKPKEYFQIKDKDRENVSIKL